LTALYHDTLGEMPYRKREGSLDEWHSKVDCPLWPRDNYLESTSPPANPAEHLSIQCIRLQSNLRPNNSINGTETASINSGYSQWLFDTSLFDPLFSCKF
jgi:hypothetical protein